MSPGREGAPRLGRRTSCGWSIRCSVRMTSQGQVSPIAVTVPMRTLLLGTVTSLGLALPLRPRRPRRTAADRTDRASGVPRPRGDPPGHRPRPPVGRRPARRRAAALHPARPGDADRLAGRALAPGRVPQQLGLGQRRDRADGARGRPRLREEPPDLHLPGRHDSGRRPRRPRHRLAARPEAPQGDQDQAAGRRLPHQLGAARRLPAADRQRRARCSSAPATPRSAPTPRTSAPSAARRCASTGSPARRGRATRSSGRRSRNAALRPHLRPPQRPGPQPALRRHPVVDRAGHLPRRRGQPARQRRRLRLQPGARLQRVGPDDRPVPARQADRGRCGAPATRRSRPPAAASSTARASAPTTAPSRSPPSRTSGCSS